MPLQSTQIEQVFGDHYPDTRITALTEAIKAGERNGVEPFPAAPNASERDKKAVAKAAKAVQAALAAGDELSPSDVTTLYLGRELGQSADSANDDALLAQRMAMAINDYNELQARPREEQ